MRDDLNKHGTLSDKDKIMMEADESKIKLANDPIGKSEVILVEPEIKIELVNVTEGARKGSNKYILEYGSKRVDMYCSHIMHGLYIDTFVENVEESKRLPNETSILYTKVNELCQTLADELQEKVKYFFKTKYPQLAKWALTKGNEVFHWDRIDRFEKYGDNGERLTEDNSFQAEKTYNPRQIT